MTKMTLFTGKQKFIEQKSFILLLPPGWRYDFILTKIPRSMTLFRFGVLLRAKRAKSAKCTKFSVRTKTGTFHNSITFHRSARPLRGPVRMFRPVSPRWAGGRPGRPESGPVPANGGGRQLVRLHLAFSA